MTKDVTEAEMAITLANAFGRKPPEWAVETRRQELREAGQPTMSEAEAVSVRIAATFGRVPDPARLAEAERVIAKASGSSGTPDLRGRMTSLMDEMTSLAESRFGYSAERARLYAQDQALDCRELAGSVSEAVSRLELRRDSLRKRPVMERKSR